MTWKEIWNLTYGKCANCDSRNWQREKTGLLESGYRKVSTYSRKCLSCNSYNGDKWWLGPVLIAYIFIPPIFILKKFFPGQVIYPTYISEEVFFIFVPIYFLSIHLLLAVFYNFFSNDCLLFFSILNLYHIFSQLSLWVFLNICLFDALLLCTTLQKV